MPTALPALPDFLGDSPPQRTTVRSGVPLRMQAHRQRDSTRRSVEYYRSWEGKVKKALHNHNRRCRTRPAPVPGRAQTADRVPGTKLEGRRFDAGMVCSVQMVTSLIEGRRVSEAEMVRMLVRAVRQHSLARRRRREYLLSCWEGSLQSP